MSEHSDRVMEVLHVFARTPRLMASNPDELNGMVVAFAAVVLADATGKPIGMSLRDVDELIRKSMSGVYPSKAIIPSLADEGFPNRNRTYESFEKNFPRFLQFLESRIRPTEGTDAGTADK